MKARIVPRSFPCNFPSRFSRGVPPFSDHATYRPPHHGHRQKSSPQREKDNNYSLSLFLSLCSVIFVRRHFQAPFFQKQLSAQPKAEEIIALSRFPPPRSTPHLLLPLSTGAAFRLRSRIPGFVRSGRAGRRFRSDRAIAIHRYDIPAVLVLRSGRAHV